MSIFSLVVLIFSLSLVGMFLLVGARIFLVRKLTAERLRDELVSGGNFFDDFAEVSWPRIHPAWRSKFAKWGKTAPIFYKLPLKKYYRTFLNFVYGRHCVEKNGCDGYWKEINGKK